MLIFIFIITTYSSSNYKIPSYYGSREQDFLLRDSILNGNLSSFYWYPSISRDEQSLNFYVGYQNAIFLIDSSIEYNIQDNRSTIIAGQISTVGSYKDGDASSSKFNNIASVIFFSKNETEAKKEYTKKTIIISNNGTDCLNADFTNYTGCLDTTSDPVNLYNIKDVYQNIEEISQETYAYLYVVDKDNHCIRQIDLQKKITKTFAGICGEKGFKDGLLGINQFNQPDQMGIDALGNLFVNDSGNNFIRMISPNGVVSTLISGSCRQDLRYPNQLYGQLSMKRVICLKNWVKVSGEPSDHLVTVNYNICTQHITDCK